MTQAEFEAGARRVLRAFNVAEDAPVRIEHKTNRHYSDGTSLADGTEEVFYLYLDGEDVQMVVASRIGQTNTLCAFAIRGPDVEGSLRFIDRKSEQILEGINGFKHPSTYDSLMLRALFRLGYDIDPIAEKLGIVVTAHEKAEWYLEDKDKFSFNREGEWA